ncbi:MAG: hypothetical protein ACOCZ2_02675 [Thermodesulfobacteriota bacterium]
MKKLKKTLILTISFGLIALMLGACASKSEQAESPDSKAKFEETMYTRYNIHYYERGSDLVASCVNYIDAPGHGILEYNTECKLEEWEGRGFKIMPKDTQMVIYFKYSQKYMPGTTLEEYVDLIMSKEPVSYKDLSSKDREGIEIGEAKTGMSKQGVKVALGYPAKHRTPSLENDTWTYWQNRFNTRVIHFNDQDKVTDIK